MRIIEIMDNLSVAGGVNSFVYDLCAALKRKNRDVTLIAIMKNHGITNIQVENLRANGVDVICLGANNKKDAILNYIPKLRREIKRISQLDNTVCNLHLKLSVLMGTVACLGLRNIKIVETYHSQYSRYWLQNYTLQFFIKKYIACSESAKKEMLKRFNVDKEKIVCIPNGVDNISLRNLKTKYETSSVVQIVSAGRFTEQKNLAFTCDAFSSLCSPTIIYTVFGEGPQKNELLKSRNNNPNIYIKGPVSRQEIISIVSAADLVVMPSLWEGLSIFLLETLAVGTPLILSDIPSFTDTMNERPLGKDEKWRVCRWGYLVSNTTKKGYQEALEHFISNKDIRREMSKNILEISNQFDIDNTANAYYEEYVKLFSKCRDI